MNVDGTKASGSSLSVRSVGKIYSKVVGRWFGQVWT